MPQKLTCPIPGCGMDVEYVRYAATEIFSKNVQPFDISNLGAVARNILVLCPVHGQKIIQKFGHHIDEPGPFKGAKVGGGWQTKRGRRKPKN